MHYVWNERNGEKVRNEGSRENEIETPGLRSGETKRNAGSREKLWEMPSKNER